MTHTPSAAGQLKPAACPLLAAVLPVRYAIGPLDPRHPSSLEAEALGLPALAGAIPDLGPDHPQLQDRALGYVPRLLRDGWLYVWEEARQTLNEYQVEGALLKATRRNPATLQHDALHYLMLVAGSPASLAWSPIRWSDARFQAAREQADLRQRCMRKITPGLAPASGPLLAFHPQIADNAPENFRWSCAREPAYWALSERELRRLRECEQQHYAVVDDPWAVLIDLAGLLRARNQAFDKLTRHRNDDWAVASVIRAVGDSDKGIRLPDMVDYPRLQATLYEQEREFEALEQDRRRIAECWSHWFDTLEANTCHSLASACGHFDIGDPAARDGLEASFAAAILGPSATASGIKAIERALRPGAQDEPWLLWAVLGVAQRIGGAELKQLLHIPETLETLTGDLAEAGANMARALALSTALNHSAGQLERLAVAAASEPLPAALAPVLGGHLRTLAEQTDETAYVLMAAMLARSQQRLEAAPLTPRQALQWLSLQMGQEHGEGRRRNLQNQMEELARQEGRAVPHLKLLPSPRPGHAAPLPPAEAATLLRGQGVSLELPRSIGEIIEEAPLKSLIFLVAAWNLWQSGGDWFDKATAQNTIAVGSATWALGTAFVALIQQVAETQWEHYVAQVGATTPVARHLLLGALGFGAATMLAQAVTAGLDAFLFGWKALDTYRAGDLDSSATYAGLSGTSAAYARVSWQAMQTYRAARAAVLAGEAEALATGVRVLSLPLRLSLLGLTVTMLAGLVSLLFTQDTPLERWIKGTRFGIRPADWAGSYLTTLQAFYQVVLPVRMSLERLDEINPYTGALSSLYLFIRLPGQRQYRQGMLSFDGQEEWRQGGLFGFGSEPAGCRPLAWSEDDPIPFQLDQGSRALPPEADGSLRLRRVYHEEDDTRALKRIRGTLVYQPIDGLSLPPIDIDLD